MAEAGFSETSVTIYHTTQHYIQEDNHNIYRQQYTKSRTAFIHGKTSNSNHKQTWE
jgi:hypothetical protein